MKKLAFSIFSSLFFLFFLLILNWTAFAQSAEDIAKQLTDKQAQIQQLQSQLQDTQKQEKTLKNQLDIIDGQTKITQLKIEETNLQIQKLEREINDLSGRIDRLSATVDNLSEVLLDRIVKTYKYGDVSVLDLLFSSQNFSETLERLKYIQVAQANDKRVLYQLQATKAAYHDQKTDKETRQVQAEKLSKDLESYKKQLDQQKSEKNELLRATKNDEAKFQALIAQLQADASSLARALAGAGVKVGPVNKGDRIAVVGNSGCSTGPHLHFEVMTPSHIENNNIIGSENKVDPKSYLDSGRLGKPVGEYSGNDCSQGDAVCHNGDISTRFHQWYNVLGGSFHTGLDIADFWGAPIYAADNGIAYQFQDSVSCSLTGTAGKGIAIDHQNGIVTLYWHIP